VAATVRARASSGLSFSHPVQGSRTPAAAAPRPQPRGGSRRPFFSSFPAAPAWAPRKTPPCRSPHYSTPRSQPLPAPSLPLHYYLLTHRELGRANVLCQALGGHSAVRLHEVHIARDAQAQYASIHVVTVIDACRKWREGQELAPKRTKKGRDGTEPGIESLLRF
jgi:hypothetical protein